MEGMIEERDWYAVCALETELDVEGATAAALAEFDMRWPSAEDEINRK